MADIHTLNRSAEDVLIRLSHDVQHLQNVSFHDLLNVNLVRTDSGQMVCAYGDLKKIAFMLDMIAEATLAYAQEMHRMTNNLTNGAV
jgi:hypothetical protein